MCISHAAGNKKVNVLCLSEWCHWHLPCTCFFPSPLPLPQLLKEKNDWGDAKAYLILKETESHTNTSKQAGDLQEGKEFKHFLFCIYRHPSHYIFLDLLHWLKHLLQYWIEVTEYSSLFLTFKGKHLGFLPLNVVWSIWFS